MAAKKPKKPAEPQKFTQKASKKRKKCVAAIVILIIAVLAVAAGLIAHFVLKAEREKANQKGFKHEIDEHIQSYREGIQEGFAENATIYEQFTDDILLLNSSGETHKGPEAVGHSFRMMQTSGVKDVKIELIDYGGGQSDRPWSIQTEVYMDKDGKTIFALRLMQVYRRINGELKIRICMWQDLP